MLVKCVPSARRGCGSRSQTRLLRSANSVARRRSLRSALLPPSSSALFVFGQPAQPAGWACGGYRLCAPLCWGLALAGWWWHHVRPLYSCRYCSLAALLGAVRCARLCGSPPIGIVYLVIPRCFGDLCRCSRRAVVRAFVFDTQFGLWALGSGACCPREVARRWYVRLAGASVNKHRGGGVQCSSWAGCSPTLLGGSVVRVRAEQGRLAQSPFVAPVARAPASGPDRRPACRTTNQLEGHCEPARRRADAARLARFAPFMWALEARGYRR